VLENREELFFYFINIFYFIFSILYFLFGKGRGVGSVPGFAATRKPFQDHGPSQIKNQKSQIENQK